MDFYIPGSETRFAQTGGPQTEYKNPFKALWILITHSKDSKIIYNIQTPVKFNEHDIFQIEKKEYYNLIFIVLIAAIIIPIVATAISTP